MNKPTIRPSDRGLVQPSRRDLHNALDGAATLAIVRWDKGTALDITIHDPDRILGLLRERIIPKGLIFEHALRKYTFDSAQFSKHGVVDGIHAYRHDGGTESQGETLPLQSFLTGGLRFWIPFDGSWDSYCNRSKNLRGYDAITHLFAFVGYKVSEPMNTGLQSLTKIIQKKGFGDDKLQTIHFDDGSAIQYNGQCIYYSNRSNGKTVSIYPNLGVMDGPEQSSLTNNWADIEPRYREMMGRIQKKFG